jgi:hypothetical protein
MADIPLSLLDRRVAHGRYPLGFQAPEHPLHRRIIPTISSPAHALTHAISPKALAKTPASIVRALVGVEQQTLRLPSLLVSDLLAIVLHHGHDATATGSTAVLGEQLVHPTAQSKAFYIRCAAPETPSVVARAGHFKHLAQPLNRLVDAQLVNQRERSRSSDIKSAVAFFKIDFSRSRRAIRASSSWIFCCSIQGKRYGVVWSSDTLFW